ncbi:MAG: hypothetical protein HC881_06960 [Leptolyngbyaceae cyanobacterium SL_7_1]|nr:hypothetical protein [Leptolyngbyaceae cyanobacterium SL_7_1]
MKSETMSSVLKVSLAAVLTFIPSAIGLSSAIVLLEERFEFNPAIAHLQTQPTHTGHPLPRCGAATNSRLQHQQIETHYTQWHQAQRLLQQNEPRNAIALARQLPTTYPWEERRTHVIAAAETKLRQTRVCQLLSLGFAQCH